MEEEIKRVFLSCFEEYAKRNWGGMLPHLSASMTAVGARVDEYAPCADSAIALLDRDFKQASGQVGYKFKSINVFPLGNDTAYLMALSDVQLTTPGGLHGYSNSRVTAILRREEPSGKWRVVHVHWSQPTVGSANGESPDPGALGTQGREKELEERNSQLYHMNDVKNKLFSIVAHDLKSPFNAFMGITDMMIGNFEEEFGDKEYFFVRLQLLNETAHDLYDLTENLLNWATLNASDIKPKLRDVPIDAIVQKQKNILRPIWMKKGIRINEHIPNELMVETDPDIIAIAVRNVISNAIKFSFKNGVIDITADINDGLLEISVADYGVGMTPQQANRVFEGYASTRGTDNEKGSGIGLVTCKEFVEKLGGKIGVKSELNRGTTFTITIPL